MIVQTALIGGSILVGVVLIRMIIKQTAKSFERDELDKTAAETISKARQEIRSKYKSYTDSEYQNMANSLERAFYDVGTEEKPIYNIIGKCKTPDDFKSLIVAFGKRDINKYGDMEVDLVTALNDELDEDEIGFVKEMLSTINVTI